MGIFLNRLHGRKCLSFKWMFHLSSNKNVSNNSGKDEVKGTEEPKAVKKGVPSNKQQSIQEESYFNKIESEQLEHLKKKKQEESEENKK